MNEEILPDENNPRREPVTQGIPEAYILRSWKEYAGESALIIFSVLLALVLTEFITSLHERDETRELLANIRNELITNKKFETEQYAYHLRVLSAVDAALADPVTQKKIVSDDEFHISMIAPDGILYRYLMRWPGTQLKVITYPKR